MDMDDYMKYRGKCKIFAEEEVRKNSNLKLVKGWYYCPILNIEEPHYWCENEKGEITDPTKLQFPSKGIGEYKKYNGVFPCSCCKTDIKESEIEESLVHSKYIFCTTQCYKKFVMG